MEYPEQHSPAEPMTIQLNTPREAATLLSKSPLSVKIYEDFYQIEQLFESWKDQQKGNTQ